MAEGSLNRGSPSTGAVFLSYASEDADAAERICTGLRAVGIEVWLDKSELRGGEAWDREIRRQIHDCTLFVPLISAHSEARHEGYFRREWRLAVERAGDMAEDVPFLLPVVIDETSDAAARVPDRFREVQWSRVPGGHPSPAFIQRVLRLLSSEQEPQKTQRPRADLRPPAARTSPPPSSASLPSRRALLITVAGLVGAALVYLLVDEFGRSTRRGAPGATAQQGAAAFAPPPHSIAVLPFVNMSGDKEQEYFSEGLTEELLNSLAGINELRVAARTSAFSFKGKDTDIGTVARKLNVGAVLEGSVRRSGNTVRITAQLIDAVTGFHLWSHTYDRDVGDVLRLETEIADAVASALKVSLLGDVAAKIETGGTHNPKAFDAYLRASNAVNVASGNKGIQTAIAEFSEAIRLDPNYALAFAGRSLALVLYAINSAPTVARESFDKAESDARRAILLAPDLAEGHLALEYFLENGSLDFARASEEYGRALAIAPGSGNVLRYYGRFAVDIGRTDAGIAAARRAVSLDPLNHRSHQSLGLALFFAHRYQEAIAAFEDSLALNPDNTRAVAYRGLAWYALGNFQKARDFCGGRHEDDIYVMLCLALTDDKLGRRADAEAVRAKLLASAGEAAAYQYGELYAQWGRIPEALDWLEKALRLRDPGLVDMKVDPLLDPLRKEPRFEAIERELKFPPS